MEILPLVATALWPGASGVPERQGLFTVGFRNRLLGVALAISALAMLPVSARAASPSPTVSIAASPRLQTASAATGASATFPIHVRNFNEHDPLPVSFELGDLDVRGWLAAPHSTPYSLVGLATLPESIILGPGETKAVSVVVHSDGRAHYGAVVVVAGPPTTPLVRIVLKIVLTPPDASAQPDIQLAPASTGTVKLDLRNTGEGLLSAWGVLFFLSTDGHFLGRLDIPEMAVLPHGESSFTLQWPEKLPSGTIARAVLTLEGRNAPFVVNASVP